MSSRRGRMGGGGPPARLDAPPSRGQSRGSAFFILLALALVAAVAFGVAVGRATAAEREPDCPEWTWGAA